MSREKFEIFAFSFGPNEKDKWRKRASLSFDQFLDVRLKSDSEISSISREMEIDIAVNLGGYTQDSRTGVFANLAAPIQVNFLGFPGTMGAAYIDYLVADHSLITSENENHFSEKIVYMPHSYQSNLSVREISNKILSRQELGLPENGFIFCCFNNTFKITPIVFDSWARILKGVENSVMMIYVSNKLAQKNLIKEIKLRGISPERLVFGEQIQRNEYLDRYRLADLFLDTFPYNAGTTASDALKMGLPLLTLKGDSFNSREAANIVNAVNLPEMVTSSKEEYESLAIELANNPNKFRVIKEKLVDNLSKAPLYLSLIHI